MKPSRPYPAPLYPKVTDEQHTAISRELFRAHEVVGRTTNTPTFVEIGPGHWITIDDQGLALDRNYNLGNAIRRLLRVLHV